MKMTEKQTNLQERLDRVDFRSSEMYRNGISGRMHVCLTIELLDELTAEGRKMIDVIQDGLYVVTRDYKWSETEPEDGSLCGRFEYAEQVDISCKERLLMFSNGDGWMYVVDFDDVVGVGCFPSKDTDGNPVMRNVIIYTDFLAIDE